MAWCPFYESAGLKYYCNVVDRNVGWGTYNSYCNSNHRRCPYFNSGEDDYDDDMEEKKGGCFLTSACVISKNLPDNCEELQILRWFRDKWIKTREGGTDDIKFYYEVAPKIVNAIDKQNDSQKVYLKIYEQLVLPCVSLIKEQRYEEAYNKYKSTVFKLQKQLKII